MSESREPLVQDQDLVLLARWCDARDQGAFAELVERHRAMVEGVCRRELPGPGEVDDVVQEVFIALADEAGSIRGAPGPWLRTVALHRCLNHLRARQRRRLHEGRGAGGEVAPEPRTASEAAELVTACLAELGEDERDLLVQLFFHGHSQAEVARRSRVPALLVHRRCQRALASLRQRFARRGQRIGLAALALLLAGGNQALATTAVAGGGGLAVAVAAGLAALVLVPAIVLVAQARHSEPPPPVMPVQPAGPGPDTGGTGGGIADVPQGGAAASPANPGTGGGALAGGLPPPAPPGFSSRFLLVDVSLGDLPTLPTTALHGLGMPLAPSTAALVVAIDAQPALPAIAWQLLAAPGRLRLITPLAPDVPGGGREMTVISCERPPPRIDDWVVSRQVVVDAQARGVLLMVVEQRFNRSGPTGPDHRRWSWYGQDRIKTTGYRPTLIYGRSAEILVLDASWRDLDPGECARWVADCPPDKGAGVEQ